jgi:hypothetical protein
MKNQNSKNPSQFLHLGPRIQKKKKKKPKFTTQKNKTKKSPIPTCLAARSS